jgi:hypothetical protein
MDIAVSIVDDTLPCRYRPERLAHGYSFVATERKRAFMTHALSRVSDRETIFRLGAVALAAGVSVVWSGVANATIVEEEFYGVDVSTIPNLLVDDGSPSGQAQYVAYPAANGIGLLGAAGIEATAATVAGVPNQFRASDLSAGDSVGSSDTFVTLADTSPTAGAWYSKSLDSQIKAATGTDYLGLRFSIDSGPDLYGYITIVGSGIANITYDTTGNSIVIGAPPDVTVSAPEPVSLGLLALGAAGVAGLRRRRAPAA